PRLRRARPRRRATRGPRWSRRRARGRPCARPPAARARRRPPTHLRKARAPAAWEFSPREGVITVAMVQAWSSVRAVRVDARAANSVRSPPPCGEGLGGGGGAIPSQVAPSLSHRITPLPSPPPQGGREQTECAARLGAHKALPFDNGDATRYRPANPGA